MPVHSQGPFVQKAPLNCTFYLLIRVSSPGHSLSAATLVEKDSGQGATSPHLTSIPGRGAFPARGISTCPIHGPALSCSTATCLPCLLPTSSPREVAAAVLGDTTPPGWLHRAICMGWVVFTLLAKDPWGHAKAINVFNYLLKATAGGLYRLILNRGVNDLLCWNWSSVPSSLHPT